MSTIQTPAGHLVDRLSRPQRLGVFGRRGVGKTTLLTMLYREAAGGRLDGLRLAAGNAATARYLVDRIGLLETGQPLPATLDQTELHFHLHGQGSRVELVVFDYQGEHVELGRDEPIRGFLRDCDAVWLCLDAALAADPAARWQAEQEVEQLAEDYLAVERAGEPHRPMALVVTRGDLLTDAGDVAAVRGLLEPLLGMTRHTLQMHCPWQGVFAVSSLGGRLSGAAPTLRPAGLDGPLHWLLHALQARDEARLERLWQIAGHDLPLLDRATRAFLRRHPEAATARGFRRRLTRARWRQRRRRLVAALGVLAGLVVTARASDTLGHRQLEGRLRAAGDDPAAQLAVWHTYQRWHPTRHWFLPGSLPRERQQIAALEQRRHDQQRDDQLARLRRLAADPDADPLASWAAFLRFRDDFPEHDLDSAGLALRDSLRQAADARRAEAAARLLRDLDRAEASWPLEKLAAEAARLATEQAGAPVEAELLRRRAGYLRRLDERAFAVARDYSAAQPLNFHTRREKYQTYLDRHPDGVHAAEARAAVERIPREWDRHDYLTLRDLWLRQPDDLEPLRGRGRAYLVAHPDGRYRRPVAELLRWCDRVAVANDYQVILKSASFSSRAAHLFSRGLSLSVEIEVAGVRYGPSAIVRRSYQPTWDYEFPRKVRWRRGDPVRIVVTDHYFWKRRVGDVTFDDPLALRRLTGTVELPAGTLRFSGDFTLPALPPADELPPPLSR